jgi:hypothetical protein
MPTKMEEDLLYAGDGQALSCSGLEGPGSHCVDYVHLDSVAHRLDYCEIAYSAIGVDRDIQNDVALYSSRQHREIWCGTGRVSRQRDLLRVFLTPRV